MTLAEFRKIIKGLPGAMDIAIEINEESLMPICPNTNVVQLQFNDTKEKRFVLVIKPCKCQVEMEKLCNFNLN